MIPIRIIFSSSPFGFLSLFLFYYKPPGHAVRRFFCFFSQEKKRLLLIEWLKIRYEEEGFHGFLTIEREVGNDPTADIALAVQFLKERI